MDDIEEFYEDWNEDLEKEAKEAIKEGFSLQLAEENPEGEPSGRVSEEGGGKEGTVDDNSAFQTVVSALDLASAAAAWPTI